MNFPSSLVFNDNDYDSYQSSTAYPQARDAINQNDIKSFGRVMEEFVLDGEEVQNLARLILIVNRTSAHAFMADLLASQLPTLNDPVFVDGLFKTIQDHIDSDPELKDVVNLKAVLISAHSYRIL